MEYLAKKGAELFVYGFNIPVIRIPRHIQKKNNMKKLLLVVTAAALTFAVACKKKTTGDNGGGTKAPTSYTSKALLEYYTGAWCGYCPDGRVYAENLTKQYGADKFYYVTFHYGDNMQNQDGMDIMGSFGVSAYPTGMVNRLGGAPINRGSWGGKVAVALDEPAKCGLSIDATTHTGLDYKVKVKLGIAGADLPSATYKMNVFLVKKSNIGVGSVDGQINYYYGTSGHPYYQKGTLISGKTYSRIDPYDHPHVFLDALTPALGSTIVADNVKAGALSEYTYDVSITNGAADEYFILAFVGVGGVSPQILNVQKVEFDAAQAFD
ncbi:MAG: Omp28-related outer membrane protein [Bacteroidetes bacterium]|nr:Omp28-related outer membrane protein [Bacteroidota bacterium]